MLSDEEEKALKVVNKRTERLIEELKIEEEDLIDEPKIAYLITQIEANKTLVNLIEKQQKEIEHQIEKRANQRNELAILNAKQIEFNKLVNIVNSYKGQFKRQQKEIEELKEDNKKKSIVIIEYQDLYEKLEDKIKAKIEEYKKQQKEEPDAYLCIKVLQSLLEKE